MKHRLSTIRFIALTVFLVIVGTLLASCVPDNKDVAVLPAVGTTVPTISPTPTHTPVPSVVMEPPLEQPAETATAVAQPVNTAPIITWHREDDHRCLQARIGREWLETGICEGETIVFALPEQYRLELETFLDTFYSFTADTKAGHLTFNGSNRGLNAVPFPAQERMVAYWAWVVYEEVSTGASPTWNQVFTWQKAENDRCQQLNVTLTGFVAALSCDNEELVELGRDVLGAEDLAQFYGWIDSLAVTNTADFNLVGSGSVPINPDQETAIDIFAQNQFARLAVNTAEAGGVTVEPLTKAAYFTVAGWSADSRWLAYWASSQADVDEWQPYTMPGGTLHFADTTTGEICAADTVHTATDREAIVYWLPENEVVVVLPGGAFVGRPCESFALLLDFVPPQPKVASDPALSPDGRYRTFSRDTTTEDGTTLTVTTTIVDLLSGVEVATSTWQRRGGLWGLGELGLGGMWLSATQFLIHDTLGAGPLIMDVERGTTPVLTGLPGLSLAQPDPAEETGLWVMAAPGMEPDTFSLVISGMGIEAGFTPVVLYHAAAGQSETLPFHHVWNFSSSYEWLFLYETVNIGANEGYNIWGRRLADIGGEWHLIAPVADYLAWREDGSEIAYIQNENRVIWQTFPTLERIGTWHTGPYWVHPVPSSFSPDGRFLVVQGNRPHGTWQYGLFLLER